MVATIENVNQSSIRAGVKHPCETVFLSHTAEKLVRLIPSFRGATMVGSTLVRCIPFLDKRVYLSFEDAKCYLDLRYKTQFGFAVRPYELYESLLVLRLLNKSDTFFDIGSNWGYYSFLGSVSVGQSGKVVAIEANPRTYLRLLQTISSSNLSNVLPFNFAASNINGANVCIKVPWYKVDTGGFIKTSGSQGIVRTRTLDTIWRQVGCPRVSLVKMDIEGAEPMALIGGKEFFTSGVIFAALIEVSNYVKRFGYGPDFVYDRMNSFGFTFAYKIDSPHPVLLENSQRANESYLGNVLFCKEKLCLM
jgi:FkbM family methyltransferase